MTIRVTWEDGSVLQTLFYKIGFGYTAAPCLLLLAGGSQLGHLLLLRLQVLLPVVLHNVIDVDEVAGLNVSLGV